ncbi:MAG TPA: DUF3500 domain-containing protein [Gemmatales bacterium]|nr:DUF3500 domain-containing protein [Gemmatales bacterium]
MNDLDQKTSTIAGSALKRVALLLGAMLLCGVSIYASRDSQLSASATTPEAQQDKQAPNPRAVEAATAFLDSLDTKLREKALYEFDSEKKSNWSNLPVTMVPRNGVRVGDLTKEQRTRAMNVVAAVLSKGGYQKVLDIVDGDQMLADNAKDANAKGKGGGRSPMFGADEYYLAIFGTPSDTKPWMVQFGGHHLGINITVIGKLFILTPTHTGAQPALFKRDDREVRPLGTESDTAYKLMGALNEKQRAQAIIGERAQGELLLGPGRDGKKIDPKGIKGSSLTADQQALLLDVIGTWVNITEPESATARMAAIKEKIGETYFAWSGPPEPGKPASFRVQGPSVVIEYAPQGGTGHIHTVIRNPEDEYGAGSMKR